MAAPVPTWMDIYNQWVPLHRAKYGEDMNRPWTEAPEQKQALDDQYLQALAAYNRESGTNIKPDQKMLGVNAQPNTFTPTDHSNDGFFGGIAKSLGMTTNQFGGLAALAAGGYGLYASGALGGVAGTAGMTQAEMLAQQTVGMGATGLETTSALGAMNATELATAGAGTFSAALDSQAANLGFGSAQAAIDAGAMPAAGGLVPAAGSQGAIMSQLGTQDAALNGVGSNVGGSTTKAALYGAEGYGAAASPAEMAAGEAAVKGGMSASELATKFGPTVAKAVLAGIAAKSGGGTSSGSGTGGSGDINSLISGALGNIDSMKKDYETQFMPWAKDQLGQVTDRTNASYNGIMDLAKTPNAQLSKYNNWVDSLASKEHLDQLDSEAQASAQQNGDNALAQQRRAAMARGVDPSKFALQSGAMNMATAGNRTFAGQKARNDAYTMYGNGLQTGAGLTLADMNTRGGMYNTAGTLAMNPINAGMKLATVDGAYRGGLNNSYSDLAKTQLGVNTAANAQSQYDNSHSLSGVMQTGLVNGLTNWAFGSGKSDTSSGGVVGKGLDTAANYFFGA